MQYNDEELLNINQYEEMAKAYASALKNQGFRIVQMEDSFLDGLLNEIFEGLSKIKSLLLALGGFLNTSQFYSLNERQIKKLSLIFDREINFSNRRICHDKTKCFLSFLAEEFMLIKKLIILAESCNYESQIKDIISSRLTKLNEILSIKD